MQANSNTISLLIDTVPSLPRPTLLPYLVTLVNRPVRTASAMSRRLPTEIIALVAEALVPDPNELLHPASETAQTLLALTRTSLACYFTTRHLFFQHCAYSEGSDRARRLAACLDHSPPPFLQDVGDRPNTSLRCIRSLFLDPWSHLNGRSNEQKVSAEDVETARAVKRIMLAVAPALQRLVYDVPLEASHLDIDNFLTYNLAVGEHTQEIRDITIGGLRALRSLHELVFIQGDIDFMVTVHEYPQMEPAENWHSWWPELRRLAVFEPWLRIGAEDWDRPDYDQRTWLQFASVKKLETLVLVGPRLRDHHELHWPPDFAISWWRALDRVEKYGRHLDAWRQSAKVPAPLRIMVTDFHHVDERVLGCSDVSRGEKSPGNKVLLYRRMATEEEDMDPLFRVDIDDGPDRVDVGLHEKRVMDLVKRDALRGTLFDTAGIECVEVGVD